jgi:hypothetical protein
MLPVVKRFGELGGEISKSPESTDDCSLAFKAAQRQSLRLFAHQQSQGLSVAEREHMGAACASFH